MKILEEEEFLNIRKFIIYLSYIVELIILHLENFILDKIFTYCTNIPTFIFRKRE